jgi:hypothetical protein
MLVAYSLRQVSEVHYILVAYNPDVSRTVQIDQLPIALQRRAETRTNVANPPHNDTADTYRLEFERGKPSVCDLLLQIS